MTELNIHSEIKERLNFYLQEKRVPNIVFYGPSGSGKRTIINEFIKNIYGKDKEIYKKYISIINCAHGKGIKFIRDELKFFAKTFTNNKLYFKTVLLMNADKLTIDAQSALRRCIELFSHSTRFFMIIEDKQKLLNPILSRFCEIYIPEPDQNLHKYQINKTFNDSKNNNKRRIWLHNQFEKTKFNKLKDVIIFVEKIYEKAYSCLDLIENIEKQNIDSYIKYNILLTYNNIKSEYRNEKLLMTFILYFLFIRSDYNLENLSFM